MTNNNHEQPQTELNHHLQYLKLPFVAQNYESIAKQAATEQLTHACLAADRSNILPGLSRGRLQSGVTAPHNAAFAWHAFRLSKRWISFVGLGQKKLIAYKSKIYFV